MGSDKIRPLVGIRLSFCCRFQKNLKTFPLSESDLGWYLELLSTSLVLEVLFSLLQYETHCQWKGIDSGSRPVLSSIWTFQAPDN